MNYSTFDSYSDKDLVDHLLRNDGAVVYYFFFDKCSSLIGYIIKDIFHGQIKKEELVNELYLYLSYNDWYKLKQFDYRSKITTWLGVVATRFFLKKKDYLIEKLSSETQSRNDESFDPFSSSTKRSDLLIAINQMENEHYKMIIMALDINDRHPAEVAEELGVSLANLYNLHSRARAQLKSHMQKEDYYD